MVSICSELPSKPFEVRGWNALRLRGHVQGPDDGPAVVLLHGGGQTRHSWRSTSNRLAAEGWCCYSVDQRGHGESDWALDGDYALDAFVNDVAAIVEAVGHPPVLVGASLGGLASLVAAGEGLKAAALVLVDVAVEVQADGVRRIMDFMLAHSEDGYGSLEEVASAIGSFNPHRSAPRSTKGLMPNVRSRNGRWFWHWDPNYVRRYRDENFRLVPRDRLGHAGRALEIPTLLVRGGESDVVSVEDARNFCLTVPHAELVEVEGASHMVAGDRNEPFDDAVISFLGRLPNAPKR